MKLQALLFKAARYGVAQILGTLLFIGGLGIGLSMILQPNSYLSYNNLTLNFQYASPTAWGVVFVVASIALVACVWVDTAYAQLPALILGLVFIGFGLLSIANGITPTIWAFVVLGWISIFTQIICWAEEKRETFYSYQPH